MPPRKAKRDPKTKEEFLDRMLRYDFDGDIRHVGAAPASIVRMGPNALRLTFPETGVVFDLTVHRPREENLQARMVQGARRAAEQATFAAEQAEEPEVVPVEEAPRRRGRRPRQEAPADQGQQRQAN